jgi:hypothetical protein
VLNTRKTIFTNDDVSDIVGPSPFEGDFQYEEFVSRRKEIKEGKKNKEEWS